MSDALPPPGWYQNPDGRVQWWDGVAWGVLAPQAAPAPIPAPQPVAAPQPVPQQPVPVPPTPALARPKPDTSPFVWVSLILSAVGLILLVITAVSSYRFMNELALQGGSGTTVLPGYLQGAATLLSLVAIAFAIVGVVASAKKKLGVVALILSILVLAAPVLFVVLLALWWVLAGIFSQLTGGPVVG